MLLFRPIVVVAVLLPLLVLGLSGTAHAFPVCEEEISFDPLASSDPGSPVADLVEAPPPVAPPVAAGRVVPCAMIESGELGPECADAAFYVVTNAGVLLCTVDLETLTAQQAATPAVERLPAAPSATSSAGLAASALAPSGACVPPSFFRELAAVQLGDDSVPLDRSDRPPVPPS